MFGSVPTMILFLATLAAYRLLVHTPLTKVLRERYARTQGAIESAAAAITAAEAKTAEYEHRLREARSRIFRERSERLERVHVEVEQSLAGARLSAQQRVAAAVSVMEASAETARLELQGSIGGLTAEVLRAILPAPGEAGREQAG